MKHRRRNPSFPAGLVLGAVAGAAALAWWATRSTVTATAQQVVQGGANALVGGAAQMIEPNREYLGDGSLSYASDVQERVLTAAEAAAMGLGTTPLDARSASLTAALQQAADPTLSTQTREAAARLAAQLQGTLA